MYKSANILIVTNDKKSGINFKNVLSHLGHSVIGITKDYESTKCLVNELGPQLMVIDVISSKNEEFINNIKEINSTFSDISLLFSITREDEEILKTKYEIILKNCISKPSNNQELKLAIELILSRIEWEEQLGHYREQLEEAQKEFETFSYSVSHDLRTPLRAIDGFSRIMKENHIYTLLNDEAQHCLNMISDNVKEMNCLIDDLLVFSHLNKTSLRRSWVDVKKMCQKIFTSFDLDLLTRKVEYQIEDLPEVKADPEMLKLVWYNLISNALKFSKSRSVSKIDIGFFEKDLETVFFIKDNGVGFDMRFQDKLFGIFQRLHGNDEFEGTGIGLANVRRIIIRHGGKVWAKSEVGKGATFYFSLPRLNGTVNKVS